MLQTSILADEIGMMVSDPPDVTPNHAVQERVFSLASVSRVET